MEVNIKLLMLTEVHPASSDFFSKRIQPEALVPLGTFTGLKGMRTNSLRKPSTSSDPKAYFFHSIDPCIYLFVDSLDLRQFVTE